MKSSKAWRVTLLALSITVVALGADWDESPFPKWSEETVLRLVTDSPWAKTQNVELTWRRRDDRPFTPKDVPGTTPRGADSGLGPLGGIGVPREKLPTETDLIVRWASALPIRQAVALYRQRNEKRQVGNPSDLIAAPEEDYVVEVFGIPAEVAHMGTESVEAVVRQSAWLRTKSGRTIRSNRVEAKLSALTLSVLIHFPRTEPVALDDGEIECYANFQIFTVRGRFKLKPMVYLGHLEL